MKSKKITSKQGLGKQLHEMRCKKRQRSNGKNEVQKKRKKMVGKGKKKKCKNIRKQLHELRAKAQRQKKKTNKKTEGK